MKINLQCGRKTMKMQISDQCWPIKKNENTASG